jgi:hypothetical protein
MDQRAQCPFIDAVGDRLLKGRSSAIAKFTDGKTVGVAGRTHGKAKVAPSQALAADLAEVRFRLRKQVLPAEGTNGRSGKVKQRVVAQPATGRKYGTA